MEKRFIEISAWRSISFFGFLVSLVITILMCTYKSKVEERYKEPEVSRIEENESCSNIMVEIVRDSNFWKFMLFCMVIVGSKMVFSLLFFMLPKMITSLEGENAPFGLYVSAAPLLILVFLLILSPVQANREPFNLILIGTLIASLGPIPMYFGMQMWNFMLFITIISFAEALYSPLVNVFSFDFTKPGREGTFLTLTAAPTYFTMALTGIVGGYLLENYYPAKEDKLHVRQPDVIWTVIIVFSGVSFISLYIGQDFFQAVKKQDKLPPIEDENDSLLTKKEFFRVAKRDLLSNSASQQTTNLQSLQ